jgi:replicative DNA helicase
MPEQLQDELVVRMPHNLDAERALLGAMLLDPRQIDLVQSLLPNECIRQAMATERPKRGQSPLEPLFFSAAHQAVFGAICRLHVSGAGVDLTTLAEELQSRGELEIVGGASYLATLVDELYSLHQVPEYARIIEHKWRLRNLIRTSHAIADDALRSAESAPAILERAEKSIFEVVHAEQRGDFVHIGDSVREQLAEIDALAKGEISEIGLKTGFHYLDELLAGLRPGNMIVLAARPSVGKTALALNIATNVALRQNRPTAVFSLEMSHNELSGRLLCTEGHVSNEKVRTGKLRRDEQEALGEAGRRLELAPMHVDDASGLSILELRARARRLKGRVPDLSLIVIDYLQLMQGSAARYDNRQQEVSDISRSIKGLAKELGLPIIALSQLSRQSEQRSGRDKEPKLSDLRESGAIEQDADIVIMIHPVNQQPRAEGAPLEAVKEIRILVRKNRNGRCGKVDFFYHGEFYEFAEAKKQDDF